MLDPWQQTLVRLTLAEDKDGRYAADTVAALVARQNGKGGWLEAVVLHGMFLVKDPLTLWTAHQFKTSTEAFLRIRGWIDGSDDLRRYVKRINAAHGEEGIQLVDGPRLRFLARSKSSGRGFSPQRAIFDEAQELAKVAQAAIVPSMRAQWNKQSIYTGTVPGPDVNNPEVFTRIRDRGRTSASKRLAWAEWSPKGSDDPLIAADLDLDDRKHWRAANPAMGYRVSERALQSDRDELDDDDFAREALSIWPSTPDHTVTLFGPGRWEGAGIGGQEPPRAQAIGLAVSLDEEWGSIAAAGRWPDDRFNIGAVERREGSRWLIAEAKRMQAEHGVAVLVDEKCPDATLVPELRAAGVAVIPLTLADCIEANAGIRRRFREGTVTHMNHPALTQAAANAEWRLVSDRKVLGRQRSKGDISMIEAATLALHGADGVASPSIYVYKAEED